MKTETTIAVPTACAIAPPNPITTLEKIKNIILFASIHIKEPIKKNNNPDVKINFLPSKSESLPNGNNTAVTVREFAITTHETICNELLKKAEIDGNATAIILMLITIVTNDIPTAEKAFHL